MPSAPLPALPVVTKERLITCFRKLRPKNNVSQSGQLGRKISANSCVIAAQQLWESSKIRSDSDPLHHCALRQALLQTEAVTNVE